MVKLGLKRGQENGKKIEKRRDNYTLYRLDFSIYVWKGMKLQKIYQIDSLGLFLIPKGNGASKRRDEAKADPHTRTII